MRHYLLIVEKILLRAIGRDDYRHAVEYLRRMKNMGHGAQVKVLVSKYKVLYPKRRAMIEELNKV